MRISGAGRARPGEAAATVAGTLAVGTAVVLTFTLSGCAAHGDRDAKTAQQSRDSGAPAAPDAGSGDEAAGQRDAGGKRDARRIPGVGDRLQARIPGGSRQVVAVYGQGADDPGATVRLYVKQGGTWSAEHTWPAHNGRKGWTPDHREGDKRSPVGVFTLSDAGGVLPDPGSGLPYTHSAAFTPPSYWPEKTRHDFDHVVAVDYNRVKGTSPLDPSRPEGKSEGGGIWLHVDHGSGTSGCVSISRSGMRELLRTLDPAEHPVVVMGDKASLSR